MPHYRTKRGRRDVIQCVGRVTKEDAFIEPVMVIHRDDWYKLVRENSDHFISVLAHLAAAISLLENSPKTGASSDKMFDIMLADYRKALKLGRKALRTNETIVRKYRHDE